jgi:hypothetical protein
MKNSKEREPPLSTALSQIRAMVLEIVEDPDKVELWLNSPSPALGLKRPITLLDTQDGARKVYNTLLFWELAEDFSSYVDPPPTDILLEDCWVTSEFTEKDDGH